jgi:hypothetical protein
MFVLSPLVSSGTSFSRKKALYTISLIFKYDTHNTLFTVTFVWDRGWHIKCHVQCHSAVRVVQYAYSNKYFLYLKSVEHALGLYVLLLLLMQPWYLTGIGSKHNAPDVYYTLISCLHYTEDVFKCQKPVFLSRTTVGLIKNTVLLVSYLKQHWVDLDCIR